MDVYLQMHPSQRGVPESMAFPCSAAFVWCHIGPRHTPVGDIILTSAGWRLTLITEDGGQVDHDRQRIRGFYPTLEDALLAALSSHEYLAGVFGVLEPLA